EAERKEREEAERKEREEAERKEREEAERKEREEAERKERAAAMRAEVERERAKKLQAAQEQVDKLKSRIAELRAEIDADKERVAETRKLEDKVKSLEDEVAHLGFFKVREKKSKREEISRIMSQISLLREQLIGASSRIKEYATVNNLLSAAKRELKEIV
ncbi:MAG: hypothetical protein IKG21_05695, partial [Atopobiaceae bacterium]|nr:hypothetical protein [Atopobiaceae bacterium]